MGRLAKFVLAFAAVVALALPAFSSTQEQPAERIAFGTGAAPNLDVFVLEDGPVERARSRTQIPVTQLTSSADRETTPVWSPDGSMIAAEVSNADSAPSVVVTTAPVSPVGTLDDELKTGDPEELGRLAGACPTWSPDSRSIAVARGEGIVVRTIAGGAERTLASGSCPVWSSRNQIAATQEPGRIVVIDPETGTSRALHEERNGLIGNKAWSPDGTTLAFSFSSATGRRGLAVVDASGGSSRVVAELQAGEEVGVIRWRPDGRLIAFNTEASLAGAQTKILGASPGGGSTQVLADTPRRGDRLGGWNRDGTRLVFESYSANQLSDPDFKSYITVVERDGSPQRIAEGSAPAFSPVGLAAPGLGQPPSVPSPTTPPTTPTGERGLKVAHDRGQPAIAASLQHPDDISTDLADVARSLALAAAMLLLVLFPSVLFNNTYEANAEEINGWLRLGRAPKERAGRKFTETWAGFAIFTAVTAVLYGFLDPSFGFDKASLNMFITLVLTIVVLTFALTVPGGRRYMVKNHADRGNVRVLPGTVVIAVVCVVVSRLANFSPGYLYGAIAGFVFAKELSEAEEGRQAARAAIWMLVLSLVAWGARMPLADSVAKEDPNLGVLVLDALLAVIFVAGIEGVVFGMIPLRFLAGEKLFSWNRVVWGFLSGAGAFLFLHVLLDPESEYLADPNAVPTTTIFVFFAAFGLISVALWAYFRFRKSQVAMKA